jgi:hypothetical protein
VLNLDELEPGQMLEETRALISNPDKMFKGAKVVEGSLSFKFRMTMGEGGRKLEVDIVEGFDLAAKDFGDKVRVKKKKKKKKPVEEKAPETVVETPKPKKKKEEEAVLLPDCMQVLDLLLRYNLDSVDEKDQRGERPADVVRSQVVRSLLENSDKGEERNLQRWAGCLRFLPKEPMPMAHKTRERMDEVVMDDVLGFGFTQTSALDYME